MYLNTYTRATQQQQLRLCRPNVAFLFRPCSLLFPDSVLLPYPISLQYMNSFLPSCLSPMYAEFHPKPEQKKSNAIHPHTHTCVNRTEEEEKSQKSPPRPKKPRVKTCQRRSLARFALLQRASIPSFSPSFNIAFPPPPSSYSLLNHLYSGFSDSDDSAGKIPWGKLGLILFLLPHPPCYRFLFLQPLWCYYISRAIPHHPWVLGDRLT